MKFKKVPINIKKGQEVTALYHSPFDHNLFYLACLAKTGVKLKIVLDDIDNTGIDRINRYATYDFREKYFLSKTERTNTRPLSLNVPKHLLANLSIPNLKDFDKAVGINKIKTELRYEDNLNHWIRDITSQFGSLSVVGPDEAMAYSLIDEHFIRAINEAKFYIINNLLRFTADDKTAIEFIEWIFDEEIIIGDTVSDYYFKILSKVIDRYKINENVSIERMSDTNRQENHKFLLDEFQKDKNLQKLYTTSLGVEGKKQIDDFPFYAISKSNGERLLPIKKYFEEPSSFIVAPKVLMLNNFVNLVLPYHAIDSRNVHAREVMYTNSTINCNQVFCDDKWLDWISSFNIGIKVDNLEREIYSKSEIKLKELKNFILPSENIKQQYKNWVIKSTVRALERNKYPLIFFALLQDKIFYNEMPIFYKLVHE